MGLVREQDGGPNVGAIVGLFVVGGACIVHGALAHAGIWRSWARAMFPPRLFGLFWLGVALVCRPLLHECTVRPGVPRPDGGVRPLRRARLLADLRRGAVGDAGLVPTGDATMTRHTSWDPWTNLRWGSLVIVGGLVVETPKEWTARSDGAGVLDVWNGIFG